MSPKFSRISATVNSALRTLVKMPGTTRPNQPIADSLSPRALIATVFPSFVAGPSLLRAGTCLMAFDIFGLFRRHRYG